jgi:hypothetical protein
VRLRGRQQRLLRGVHVQRGFRLLFPQRCAAVYTRGNAQAGSGCNAEARNGGNHAKLEGFGGWKSRACCVIAVRSLLLKLPIY